MGKCRLGYGIKEHMADERVRKRVRRAAREMGWEFACLCNGGAE